MEKKKKSNTWLVILISLIVGIAVGFGINQWMSSKDNNEEKVTKDTNEISSEVKTKLEKWVTVASTYNGVITSTSTLEKFAEGVTSLDANTKLVMTYNALMEDVSKQDSYTLTASDISNMETSIDKNQMNNEDVKIMKITEFNSTYKELFGEEAVYTLKDLGFGCPIPWGMDKSQDRIYLFSRCGGTNPLYDKKKITSYETNEDGGYSVHEEVNILYPGENLEPTDNDKVKETYKILWKFDKDLKFISSEKE